MYGQYLETDHEAKTFLSNSVLYNLHTLNSLTYESFGMHVFSYLPICNINQFVYLIR